MHGDCEFVPGDCADLIGLARVVPISDINTDMLLRMPSRVYVFLYTAAALL